MKNQKPTRIAVYMRVSSERQRDAGTIQIQREAIARYCDYKQIEVLEFFEDDGVSGTIPFDERPQGGALWRGIENGEFDALIAYKVDRIARSIKNFVDFCELTLTKKCTLILVDNDLDISTTLGKMTLNILAVFAEWEHSMILERAMSGKRTKINAGKILGRVPYGFDNVNNKLVVDPIRAKFVEQIFNDYVSSKSYREIMKKLNDEAAPVPPGRLRKKWAHHHVEHMLKNPAYFGEYHAYRSQPRSKGKATGKRDPDDIVKIKVPAIITKELFDQVQKKIVENRFMGPESKKRFYLLRGLIRCGRCGYAYTGRGYKGGTYTRLTGKNKGQVNTYKEVRFYECTTKYKSKLEHLDYCGNANLNAFEIEAKIWNQIEIFLLNPNTVIDKMLEQQREISKKANTTHRDLATLNNRISKAETQRKRIVKSIASGTITREEAEDVLDEIRRELAVASEQKQSIEEKLNDTDQHKQQRLNNARELLDELAVKFKSGLTDEEKKMIVELLIQGIKVYKEYPEGEPAAGESPTSKPHQPVVEVTYIFNEKFSSALSHRSSET